MNEQFEKYVAPVRELNMLAISNFEKMIDLQLKYLEDSTKANLETLKTASGVNDAEGFKEYINNQVATSKQLTERAIEDGRTVAEMGNSYVSEVQKLMKDSFKAS